MAVLCVHDAYFFPGQAVEGFLRFIPFYRSAILRDLEHRVCLVLDMPHKEKLGRRLWTLAFHWTLHMDPMTICALAL
jgi:hypothetical protein